MIKFVLYDENSGLIPYNLERTTLLLMEKKGQMINN